MTHNDRDSSISGYITYSFADISSAFTDIEIIASSQTNIVARAKRYGRWWMLKGLQADVAMQEAYRQRLRKEFEILMMLQHPNIVVATGMETVEGLGICIVMEYIDGVTLSEWIETDTTRRQRLHVVRQLIDAIGYIHSKNIVHRDIKPANIIVTHNGENVKLIDFGLADTDSHAILKQPAGTPNYISPEQMQTAVADVRNDIYSLGVILSKMNIGRGRIVRKCMNPADRRYQNVTELQSAMLSYDRGPVYIMTFAIVSILITLGIVSFVQANRIKHLKDAFQQSELEQNNAHTKVEDAIQSGYAMIDGAVSALEIREILDTLSYQAYLPTEYYNRVEQLHITVESVINDIDSTFTITEQAEISNALYMYEGKITSLATDCLMNKPPYPQQQ